MVTQSGSNALHGTVFEFLRNSALDARSYFAQGASPPFRQNQFGGSAGGPLKKDRIFLFGNYEGFRQALTLSNVAVVPDAAGATGVLAKCGNRCLHESREFEACDVAVHVFLAATEWCGIAGPCQREAVHPRSQRHGDFFQ